VKNIFLITMMMLSHSGFSAVKSSDVPWLKPLTDAKIKNFYVCGSVAILPTTKSLKKDFIIAPYNTGYFITDALEMRPYYSILEAENLKPAKESLRAKFSMMHLWQFKDQKITDLGAPTTVDFPFTSTIKDCMEGAPTSLGSNCSRNETCCREKFLGPILRWGQDKKKQFGFRQIPASNSAFQVKKTIATVTSRMQ
jgi:hypothetical protein